MGDNYFKGQAKASRRKRDLAMRDLNIPGLFLRPEAVEPEFHGKPWREGAYVLGETVWAVPSTGDEEVPLMRGSDKIGFVDGDGARTLLNACAQDGAPDVVPLVVTNILGLSGVAQLRLSKE